MIKANEYFVTMSAISGETIQLITPFVSTHSMTRDQAIKLGEALIHMANLSKEIEKTWKKQ